MKALIILKDLIDGKTTSFADDMTIDEVDSFVKEAIEELEQQQKIIELQNRSCNSCKYENETKALDLTCIGCNKYYPDRYEAKDKE